MPKHLREVLLAHHDYQVNDDDSTNNQLNQRLASYTGTRIIQSIVSPGNVAKGTFLKIKSFKILAWFYCEVFHPKEYV